MSAWMFAGSVGFVITYFAGGIFGNVLGGNFSRTGIPSAGASGALFACSAVMVVDLALHWKYEERPVLKVSPEMVLTEMPLMVGVTVLAF